MFGVHRTYIVLLDYWYVIEKCLQRKMSEKRLFLEINIIFAELDYSRNNVQFTNASNKHHINS